MKALLVLLSLCLATATADRLSGRMLLQQPQCPGYRGPFNQQNDLQIEVTYLRPIPSAQQLVKYDALTEYPTGTVFGTAVVHFSSPFTAAASLKFFKVSEGQGDVIGLEIPYDRCDITVDFVVHVSCQDECVPAGACVELDNELLREETGYELPFREGCKTMDAKERPRCMDASVSAIGMGLSENDGMAYTEEDVAHLMVMFNTPFPSYVDLGPEDFNVTGPKGTVIESVEGAMPDNPMNVAYTLTIRHGSSSSKFEEIKVCFIGGDTIRATGLPFEQGKVVCSTYMKSAKKPEFLMPSIEIRKSQAPIKFC